MSARLARFLLGACCVTALTMGFFGSVGGDGEGRAAQPVITPLKCCKMDTWCGYKQPWPCMNVRGWLTDGTEYFSYRGLAWTGDWCYPHAKYNCTQDENVPLTVEKRKAIPQTIITRSSGSRQAPFQEQGGPML
jgi:hypothetical protein